MKNILKSLGRIFVISLAALYLTFSVRFQYEIYEEVKRIESQQHELYELQVGQYIYLMNHIELNKAVLELGQQFLEKSLSELREVAITNDEKQLEVNKLIYEELKNRTDKVPYEQLKDQTVVLFQKIPYTNMGYLGTGVVVKITEDFTYILTNKHVVDRCDSNECITLDENYEKEIEVIKESSFEYDLALVRVAGKLLGKKSISKISVPQIQERVYMVGHNLGRRYLYAEGYIAGYDEKLGRSLVVGIPAGPGNSGSGIINAKGELVGLLYGGKLINHFPYKTYDTAQALCVDGRILKVFLKDIL